MAENKSNLDALPPELQLMIMTRVSSIRSLDALSKTSTQLYRVFSLSKHKLLSNFIHRTIHPDALPDVLAATFLSSRKHKFKTGWEMVDFIETCEQERKKVPVHKPLSLSTCINVCQLHRSVEYFLEDFVDQCATFSAQYGFLLSAGSPTLSPAEAGRIHLTLYRLQLYGRIFSAKVNRRQGIDPIAYAESFLFKLSEKETAEIVSLHDYFRLRLSEVYGQIEDAFIRSVLAEISQSNESANEKSKESKYYQGKKKPRGRRGRKSLLICGSRLRKGSPQTNDTLFFSEMHKRYHYDHIENQIVSGLPLLQQFLEANTREQIKVVKKLSIRQMNLSRRAPEHPSPTFAIPERIGYFRGKTLRQRNYALDWARREGMDPHHLDATIVRQCGYVFWDRARISSSGMLTEYDPPIFHPALMI